MWSNVTNSIPIQNNNIVNWYEASDRLGAHGQCPSQLLGVAAKWSLSVTITQASTVAQYINTIFYGYAGPLKCVGSARMRFDKGLIVPNPYGIRYV